MKFELSRILLIVLNLVYLVISIVLVGIAAYVRIIAYITSISIVGGIIACGTFLCILAILGLYGAVRHSQAALFFYIILLFSVFLVQFCVACACLVLGGDQQRSIVETAWASSNNSTKIDMMRGLQCCGFERVDTPVPLGMDHPPCRLANLPCCAGDRGKHAFCCLGNRDYIMYRNATCPCDVSCLTVVEQKLEYGMRLTGTAGLFFSLFELIGVWLAMHYRHQRDTSIYPNYVL